MKASDNKKEHSHRRKKVSGGSISASGVMREEEAYTEEQCFRRGGT